jgi:mannitol-1-/sugar-/sorbitol-6-phosphatase
MHLVFDALLIDMDGTLVDSTARVEKVWDAFCREHGLDFAAFIAGSHGRRTMDSVIDALGDSPSSRRIAQALEAQETEATDGIVACTGAAALLASLPASSWSLVTSAGRDLARRRMQAAGFALPAFGVYGEDVAIGKPDPACYMLGAERLGVPVAACGVLEDAPAGILAGVAAGARVLSVGPRFDGQPDAVVNLAGLDALRVSMIDGKVHVHVDA